MTTPHSSSDELNKILADLEQYGIKVGINTSMQYNQRRLREAKIAIQRLISQEAARLAGQELDVTLNAVIDAELFPTPEEHKKMLGLMKLQRQRLSELLDQA